MDFWPEFVASNWGKEFVAGGFGGIAGIVSGYPLDTLRIRLQQYGSSSSALTILRRAVVADGITALYRGMAAPLASVTFQNAVVFQTYALLSRAFDSPSTSSKRHPPSYPNVSLAGFGTGAFQTLILTPIELLKIRLQLQTAPPWQTPLRIANSIIRTEGLPGMYRGLTITALRDAPAHAFYFLTYEYLREVLHPGCRESGKEGVGTMVTAGGVAGAVSWGCCYPLDVVKTRLQSQTAFEAKYRGILDCFVRSLREEGYGILWRGLGTAVARAFVVNGAIFSAYEIALRCLNS